MLTTLFLLAPPNQQGDAGSSAFLNFLPFILVIVVIYFFMIRPQRKKQKEREESLKNIQKGDKIVTMGGLHGKVAGIDEEKNTLLVSISENVKVHIDRNSINTIENSTTVAKVEDKKSK